MLKNYSLADYLLLAGSLTLTYYLVAIALLYRKEVKNLLADTLKRKTSLETELKNLDASTEDIARLEWLVEDIKNNILLKAGKRANATELLIKIKERLEHYEGVRVPAFRYALENAIQRQAEKICGVVLSEREIAEALEGLPH